MQRENLDLHGCRAISMTQVLSDKQIYGHYDYVSNYGIITMVTNFTPHLMDQHTDPV